MGYGDAKQAVVAYLIQPRGKAAWPSAPSPGGWQAAISRGGGHDADLSTIRFAKQRAIDDQELHAVTFADKDGSMYRFLVGVVQGARDGRSAA